MIAMLVIIVCACLAAGYLIYGQMLARRAKLDDSRPTPACEINDGVDYVPAKASLLIGQHFSAIAAAGPIVGPILACLWFGWLPALLWVLIGSIFIGGSHDFHSLLASVRHKGASIGEIVKQHMPQSSYFFFLIFVWITLLYVITAFTDITAQTFGTVVAGEAFGPGVAASSGLYLIAAIIMGILLRHFRMSIGMATLIFLPVTLLIVWIGPRLPASLLSHFASITVKQWDMILLGYCFIASLIPVWLLLQPRGYLGGWFLYIVIIIGLFGALFGGFAIQYPALNLDGLKSSANGKFIFPILFITVACGACSGFHGIVSSGTTSKQVLREKDTLPIGYGTMLLEGLVAVLAIATVAMLPKGADMLKSDPNLIYASGIARYLSLIKVDYSIALPFALLAFSTFVYDTLDVCTRLARYIFQEIMGWKSLAGSIFASLISLAVPLVFLLLTKEKGYLVAWPIFGTSNQLLASLILLALSAWLINTGRNPVYTIVPMLFMFIMTIWSLGNLIYPFARSIPSGTISSLSPDAIISGICGIMLLSLGLVFIWRSRHILKLRKAA